MLRPCVYVGVKRSTKGDPLLIQTQISGVLDLPSPLVGLCCLWVVRRGWMGLHAGGLVIGYVRTATFNTSVACIRPLEEVGSSFGHGCRPLLVASRPVHDYTNSSAHLAALPSISDPSVADHLN